MSKKVVFAVQLEDNAVVETRFRKNDWRQIEYLTGKAYRRDYVIHPDVSSGLVGRERDMATGLRALF